MTYRLNNLVVEKQNDGTYAIFNDYGDCGKYRAYTSLWWEIDAFDSFIQAVKYLKENIENIL